MTARALLATLALSLVSLGCVVHVKTDPGADPKPDGDASKPGDAGETPESSGGEADKPARAPAPGAALEDCPGEDEANYCTGDGKLAGQWMPVDLLRVPKDAELVFEAAHPDADRQPSLSVAIRGDELYLRQVTCGSCRRVIGQGFFGRPAHLSPEQQRALQSRLGLGEDTPLLASCDEWKAFALDDRGNAMLTELSTHTDEGG